MGRMQDKVCLVTGGASGIGRATACTLALEGAKVAISDVATEAGVALAAEICSTHRDERALFLPHDVSSESDWDRVMETVLARFGRLDVLVNCAGVLIKGNIEETTLEQWQTLHRVNADSVFLGCRMAVQVMKRGGGGSIVNVSSITGLSARADYAAYGASKHSVLGISRAVAVHCRQQRYRIRCNSVHPDGVLTPMTIADAPPGFDLESQTIDGDPMGRMCRPQDVANAVLFLASDESRAVNGLEVRVDSGQFLMNL